MVAKISVFVLHVHLLASSVNERHYIDTRFCAHNLIKKDG